MTTLELFPQDTDYGRPNQVQLARRALAEFDEIFGDSEWVERVWEMGFD